jgi:hypothetical protein
MTDSSHTQKVNDYLKQMGGFGPLDADASCFLQWRDIHIGVRLLFDKGLLMVASPVINLPEVNLLPLFRKLLTLNHADTFDAAFSLNERFGTIDLQIKRPLEDLDYSEFRRAVGIVGRVASKFVNVLRQDFGSETIHPVRSGS